MLANGENGMATLKLLGAVAAFGVTTIGSIPTALDFFNAMKLGVGWDQVSYAREQQRLWENNFACASQPGQEVKTSDNLRVRVQACSNGNVLISVFQPNGQGRSEWVPIDRFTHGAKRSLFSAVQLIGTAHADESRPQAPVLFAQNSVTVMCLAKDDASRTIIRVVNEAGQCFRETVSIRSGEVESREAVSCDTKCE